MPAPTDPAHAVAHAQLAGTEPRRNTLTAGGYVLAGVLAVIVFAVSVGVVITVTTVRQSGVSEAVWLGITCAFIAATVATVAACVVGLPLTIIAHRLLRSVRAQTVHGVVFGVIGLIAAVCLLAVFSLVEWNWGAWLMVLGAGACTALSRLVVGAHQKAGRSESANQSR